MVLWLNQTLKLKFFSGVPLVTPILITYSSTSPSVDRYQFVEKNSQLSGTLYGVILEKVNERLGTVTEPDVQTEILFWCYLGNPHTDHILKKQSFCWYQFVEKNYQPNSTEYNVILEKVNALCGNVTEPDV